MTLTFQLNIDLHYKYVGDSEMISLPKRWETKSIQKLHGTNHMSKEKLMGY